MSQSFRLRVQVPLVRSARRRISNPNNQQAESVVQRRKIEDKEEQLIAAVRYCRENDCRGYRAIKSGLFPLIKHRKTIDDRDG